MSKRRHKVSDEISFRWSRRKRRGDSYRKIAFDEGYDRRFVAKVVNEFDRQHQLQEGVTTLREARVAFLRQHLQMLEEAALELLELAARPVMLWPLGLPSPGVRMPLSKPNIESDLLQKISALLLAETQSRGSDWFKQHMAQREAKVLVKDLKEHLPSLWEQVEIWEQQATKKQRSCKELIKHLKDKKIPQGLFESGLKEGLRVLSNSDNSEENESLPRLPDKLKVPQDVGQWLYHTPSPRKSLETLRSSRNALTTVYSQLEDILIPSKLRQTLLERRCSHCPLPQDEPRE